jgi:hypothetical protein
MRIFTISLAFVVTLLFANPASAQGFPPGPWRGAWTGSEGHKYQAELNVTLEASGRVSGQIRWELVTSPRPEEQAKIGLRGIEYVEGELDIQTGSLTLHGTRLYDPNGILGADVYRLVVSPNGQYIVGLTENNGTWRGRIDLTRSGPS